MMIMFQKTVDIHNDSVHYGILLNTFIKKDEFINRYFCSYLKNKSQEQKKYTAVKNYRQFAHPSSKKFIGLLRQSDVNDKGLNNIIKNINLKCDICTRHRKTKPKPRSCISSWQRAFIKPSLWSVSPKVWFLHIIDHVKRYSASWAVRSKKKVIPEMIFKPWVAIIGSPKKVLFDNVGEFANRNFNIWTCTPAAENVSTKYSLAYKSFFTKSSVSL